VSHNFHVYYDLDRELKSRDIDLIFEGWNERDERVAILSPHDDDALLGAGYLLLADISEGGEPFVLIFCDGSGGYSNVDEKERIVSVRRIESTRAYEKLGIREENIVRFDYPDLGLSHTLDGRFPGDLREPLPRFKRD